MKRFVDRRAALWSLGRATTVSAAGDIGHRPRAAGDADTLSVVTAAKHAADTGMAWTLAHRRRGDSFFGRSPFCFTSGWALSSPTRTKRLPLKRALLALVLASGPSWASSGTEMGVTGQKWVTSDTTGPRFDSAGAACLAYKTEYTFIGLKFLDWGPANCIAGAAPRI